MTDRFTIAYFNFLTLPKHRDAASECVNAIILKKMKADKKLALIQALNLEQVFQNIDVTVRPLFLPPVLSPALHSIPFLLELFGKDGDLGE